MKKIMISLLMIAATLNAMAITYTGKVQVVLRATSNNAACAAVIATSDALNDGLNPTYYAELNDEGKEVLAYVEYNSVRYEHFGSSAATMQNMPLIMKANASAQFRMNFYEMEGTIEIYDVVAGANIDKSQPYIFTIEDAQKNSIIADRFIINYVPAPVAVASVTTNAYGWATFSYSEDLVPVNATAQTLYKGAINGSYLDLTEVNDVQAETGVLVYGAPNTTYQFAAGTATSDFSANALLATSSYSYPMENVYVLKGNAFQPYEGTNALAANKAYIRLSANNAPARISFRFNGAQAIENAEMEDAKAVKFVENGQIFIRRGEAVYNMQGQIVK